MGKFNPRARHRARRLLLQATYQWQMTHGACETIVQQFLAEADSKNTDLNYFKDLLPKIIGEYATLDATMAAFLDRPIASVDYVELAILRVAIAELCYHPEIPYRVIINEAVDLAKGFGAEEGHKYVNGILDRVAHKLRPNEIKS